MVLYMNSNSLALYALLVVAAVCGQNDPVAPTTTSGRRPWTASFARTFDVTASGQNDTVAPTTISTRTAPKSMRLPLARTAPSARSSDATATRTEFFILARQTSNLWQHSRLRRENAVTTRPNNDIRRWIRDSAFTKMRLRRESLRKRVSPCIF